MTMPTSGSTVAIRGHSDPPRVVYVGIAFLGIAGVAVLYAFDPRDSGNYPVCPFLGLTGCYCPGCGTLRSLRQLLYRDLFGALGYNPLTVLSLPFIAYSYATGAMRAFRVPAPPPTFVPHRWIWGLLVGIAAFWTLRNVPVEPLNVLAP